MTDIRAGEGTPLDDDDKLPWLEAVDEDDDRSGPSAMKLFMAVLVGLVAIGLVVGGLFWMSNDTTGGGGEPELIAAQDGDYKVQPDDPGGMKVDGEGDTSFAASAGADPKGAINVNAMAEAPVTPTPGFATPKAAPKAAPKALAKAEPKAPPAAPKAAPAAAGAGGTVQLGAFSSQAGANAAWKAMSGRFAYLSPLTNSVTPVTSGGKTLYRLRASGPGASNLCGRLRVAGESCVVID